MPDSGLAPERLDRARHWLDLAAALPASLVREGWVPPALEAALECCTGPRDDQTPRTASPRLLSLLCASPHATEAPSERWLEEWLTVELGGAFPFWVLLPWPGEERRDGRFGPTAVALASRLAAQHRCFGSRIAYPALGVVVLGFVAREGSAAAQPAFRRVTIVEREAITAVVITKGDRPRLLTEAIRSVLDQTTPPEAIVVVEDCAREETATLLAPFGSRIRHLPAQPGDPSGQAAAMNRAIQAVETGWIAWLDDDDRWAPAKLELQRARLRMGPDLLGTGYAIQDEQGRTQSIAPLPPLDRQPALRLLLHGSLVTGPSLVVRKSLYERVGGYDASFLRLADYEFLARALPAARLEVIPLPLTWVRRHAGNRRGPEVERAIRQAARRVLLQLRALPLERLFPEVVDHSAPHLRSRALLERGAAGWRQGLVAEAEADFAEARGLTPDSLEALLLLGRLLLAERRLDEAERAFSEARALAPGQLAVWLGTGLVAAARERWQEAEEAFRRGLEIDPLNPVARTNLILHRFRVPGMESPLAIEVEAMTRDLLLRLRPAEIGFSLLELDDPALQRPFGPVDAS
ncbi:MAG: glycosyltransferase [Candidatus Eisenbacteria bacterium]|nr:glycosyltransferase [Candidatus Eisenbacteria bacterium]